jgi:hypothetical protein
MDHDCACLLYCLLCRKEWAQHYPNQNLEVYSANPLLVYPTHYVGDAEWFSDTGQIYTHTLLYISLSPSSLSSSLLLIWCDSETP